MNIYILRTLTQRYAKRRCTRCTVYIILYVKEWDSVVGIANRCYELVGLGIKFRWQRDFSHLSRPTLGPYLRSCTMSTGFLFRA
jgi:hypothetical protein